jgi:hypothetical protein
LIEPLPRIEGLKSLAFKSRFAGGYADVLPDRESVSVTGVLPRCLPALSVREDADAVGFEARDFNPSLHFSATGVRETIETMRK